ncbi:putative Type II and III secretion system protein [Candidatus Zixiibacteriota bacterium]|nr:putative Type II and III secretion system protein [candidate division Zixibacteria bacterium]
MKRKILVVGIIFVLLQLTVHAGAPDMSKKISLQFDHQPIGMVLKIIAQQYELNMVQSGDMEKPISVKLENVDLSDALNAILNSNGFNYYFSGDVVVVKPIDQTAEGETVARAINFNYISPAAAMNAATDMLSPKGKMKIVEDPAQTGKVPGTPRASQLVIVDMPDAADKIVAFLKNIDSPKTQIGIEVKMIEVNVTDDKTYGLTWPTSLTARATGIETNITTSTSTTTTTPMALGQVQLPKGKWEWGKLTVDEVQTVLDFLQQSGHSKVISDPRITTLDNCEAEINVSTVVPIQTINRFSEAGATQDIVTFQDEEIGISLLVTPHVIDSGQMLLDVLPTVSEIIGYSGPEGNQKPIRTERSVRTKIAVKTGETAVLGGLLKESKIENNQRVFLLGSLPIIGNLFRHKSIQNSTTDLMILITPTIIGVK